MNQFATIMEYQEDKNVETISPNDIIELDEKNVVVGLQGFGVVPLRARSDGKKLKVDFLKSEVAGPFQMIQKSMAGAYRPLDFLADRSQKVTVKTEHGEVELTVGDLQMDFYSRIIKGDEGWKGLLTMMRNIPVQRP